MNYIIAKNEYETIVDDKDIKESLYMYLKHLSIKELRDYKSTLAVIKKKFGLKSGVPAYINKKILLFPVFNVNGFEKIMVNYIEILDIDIKDNKTIIYFNNGTIFELEISRNKIERALKKAELVYNYITLID